MELKRSTAYGIVPVEAKKHNGLYVREGTTDRDIIASIPREYGLLECEDQVVLDIGGHIGGFALWACNAGAKRVVSVEPDEANCFSYTKNLSAFAGRVALLRGCAMNRSGKVEIWIGKDGRAPSAITTIKPKISTTQRFPRKVTAFAMDELIRKYRPTIVKMDCEGAEYDIGSADWMKGVQMVAMELHFKRRVHIEQARELMSSYRKKGWALVGDKPVIERGRRNAIAIWKRKRG